MPNSFLSTLGCSAFTLFALSSFSTAVLGLEAKIDAKSIRTQLQNGEINEALAALEQIPSEKLIGLRSTALERSGNVKAACALYEKDLATRKTGRTALYLRQLSCVAKKDAQKTNQLWNAILDEVKDPLLLAKGFAALKKQDAKAAFILLKKHKDWIRQKDPTRDSKRREALAVFFTDALNLAVAEKESELADKISLRIYKDLGDTPAGKSFFLRKDFKELRAHKNKTYAIERARSLVQQHKNKLVLSALKRHSPKVRDVSGEACEIRYLQGKTARKMRRYRASRRDLDFVAASCKNVFQKKARYMQARVASFQNDKRVLKLFDSFANDFPEDTLTDDVLLWKAEFYARHKQKKQAMAAYQKIVADYPQGDMHGKAAFALALLQADSGDVKAARTTLAELAKATEEAPILLHDQALYWRARLAAFPELKNIKLNKNKILLNKGLTALESLALARPASYYGHLARRMSLEAKVLQGESPTALQKKLDDNARISAKAEPFAPIKLEPTSTLFIGESLVKDGYDEEALLYLDAVSFATIDENQALLLVHLYETIGHPEKAHQVLRARGKALLKGKPNDNLALWQLAYPKAHAQAIAKATQAVNLPPHVFFGLAREESAFDANVLSWAGAIGLTQLMPATAREEAQRLRLQEPTLKSLQDPFLNARLGARHLARRQNLEHPLLAIAAYNAGPGNVAKWTRPSSSSDAIDALIESITIEQTRRYVKKVAGSWVVYALLYGDIKEADFDVLRSKARIRAQLLKNARSKIK